MEFEEEHAPHPFTSFNKQPREVPTLCGNWLEERALMSVTGTTRYQVRFVMWRASLVRARWLSWRRAHAHE